MAIDRSKLQRMYKLMADNGYTQDYNTFEKKFTGDSNYANRKAVYDLFTKNGADLGGSYEEFMRKLQKPRATKPQQQPKTALGRAQQSVAQQKWGGYGGAVTPMQNDSELVRGLKNADAAQRLQAPVSYAKPGAVKQMVKQTRERQHVVGQNVEQAGRRTMQPLREEEEKNRTPVVDTGNKNLNQYVVNTQGQMERQMMDSGREIAGEHLGDYISYNIRNEFDAAAKRGLEAESALSKASPFASMVAGKAYNDALDPDMLIKNLSKKAESDMANILSDPKVLEDIGVKAAAYGVDPEEYVNKIFAPGLQAKIAEEFEKSELSRNMPKSTAEYIIRGVNDSMIGTILSMSMMSKKQRQYAQQGMAMTDEGENPDVNPNMGARVARSTIGFAADAPVFREFGKAGAAIAGKVFGNGVAQTTRIANAGLRGRIARMAGSGMVSQGVTGVLYGSTNAAVQNYSTGDDTSIGNTVKIMTMGGVSEGASWATMGGIGGVVGGSLYNVSGLKRIPAKVFQVAMEGWGMHVGGNVAKMIEGHDTDFWSVEGTLEACANVVALKLTHARLPKRYAKDGKKESYLDMVKRNLYNLTVSDGQRAAFGGYAFTKEEKEQLFGSENAPLRKMYRRLLEDLPLRPEGFTHWALRTKKTTARGKGEESYKGTDVEFVKTAYDEIMADATIPWDTKAKFSALVMGTVPSARPMMDHMYMENDDKGTFIGEYSKYGELLSKNRYKTKDERDSIIYSISTKKENQRLSNAYGAAQIKDEKAAQETLETVAETFGFTAEQLKAAMDKDPLKRSEEEQNACVALRKAYEGEQFPEGTLHPDQSQTEGKDVVEENNLGTENPNNEAVAEVLNNMNNAEKAFNAALESNDVLKQEYERLTKEGLSEPQIYMELFNSGLTQEQLAPFADYINAKAKAVGMYRGTQQKIAETVQKHVEQWSYKGELNGEKQEGGQMLFVKDNNGRLLIVGAGDVAFDGEGRARTNVGDMISVLDAEKGEMDFVSVKDVKLERTVASEEYAKEYQELLEIKNSEVYAQNEQQKQMENAAGGVTPEGGKPEQPTTEQGNAETTVQTGEENKPVPTFADGSPVPMTKDSKGRETADYSMMTPEQGAEWIEKTFGEDAEAVADGKIERAKKNLSKAEKMDIDMTADDADVLEAKAKKKAAIEAAQKELELYTNIKKAMVEKKVKATMEAEAKPSEGDVSLSKPREKFESGTRIVGNKRTRTLPDGSKIKGHYELVEADSLTPSHNANDGYKKSEGFPVNEEGRTINDRDYENDKDAQRVTDMIAKNYDGQAVDQVPVVTKDGIVVDGNGRTMAGQKAAKDGTDGAYIEALKENAENYGFTAEQIEQSGMEHPRLVLVSDEPLPYDTATFAKFNKNEKKTQGNTQQTVAISKKLGGDEISAIAAEIEGSGSLDAFFNNPTAINSLLKRLIDKGVIGLNEVAGLREGENKLSASGKDFVRNLLLGSVFSEDTIRMMGADAGLKSKALNGIRAVLDNMKLGDYALRGEIDKAVQLVYEARQQGGDVDAYLRTPAMFGENAADRYDPISQAIALALDGKAEDFRDLMMAYNRNAAHYADANQLDVFGDRPTKEEFINEFLKLRNWKNYETRRSENEGNGDVGGTQGSEPETPEGNEPTEGNGEEQREVDEAVKNIATEITKKTGIEVVTDEKEAEEVIRESEETDSDLKYHKETDEATLEELENGETVKVYRAMQVIDGKLYPPMAAAVNGKRVEANELGVWIRADENPDLAIPDIDPKTKEQKVDKKTGELKWKFKLDKGGKDATGKKATDIPAAYNPYWHTSRSPLNDQFKSAWIRPNIVVVECEVPVSELSSGYRAERAKDAVGEVDWKSGVVSGEVYKQTGRARKVILSRWCKPVRVLSDAEVAQRAKEFVGDAKVEIPENVLTPRQRIEFEKAGFKIGAPEKGVKKSDQINEALKRGLQIDNSVKEFRTKDGEVYGFTDGKKIYLDTKKMKPETPLHEYAHLWCDMLRRVNPKEWENVKKLFDKVEGLKEEVQKLYPELEGDALYEEMITTYSGREGTKKLEDVVRKLAAEEGKSVTESAKAQGFLAKVKEALTKYWKGVADVLGIHFTTAEEVADKVLADWAKGVDPLESEEGRVKSEESDTKVEGEEPPKTNPLAWLAHTAEMFKDEQVQKAKDGLVKAKESGDAEEIKRATADMKQKMEAKLRGNGIGLVERRRIIGREIGKILGEEAGKAEAEKIDKPWKDMDGEERMATAEKNPLTEEEIKNNTSEENKSLIEDAVDYVNGNHGIVQQIAYLKIYDDVRNRHENAPDNSGAEDRTQLAAADNGGSQELGVGTGRESGGPSEQLGDGTGGEGRPEQLQPGSKNSAGQPDVPTGEGSHSQGEGETSGLGGVPAGDTQRERSGGNGGNGATVRHESGRGSGNKPAAKNGGRKPAAKQGTHFPDNGSLEQKKQNTAAKKAALKDALKNWAKLGRGELGINLAGLNSRQIEYLPEVMKAVKDYGVALIDEGVFRVKDWIKNIREAIGEDMKGMKFSDKDIDDFIEEMWNSKYTMNGETHTIGEWASIYGREKLRKELANPLTEKAQRQIDVENVPVKIGDKKNIEETLPFLLPQQQEDVLRAETQFFGKEHADREHAYGKGYMFTNGTGTGKTYTGLGIAKRLVKQGKGRILIVTPSQKKVSDWIKDGRNLNMEIRDLDSWAKERGTTATTESGEGVVITTFANFGVNKKLLEENWDAVIYDESHRIMENKNGAETARSMQHYMVTNRSENHCFLRLQETNKDYQKMKGLGEQFDAEREKEVERIRKEYKASHPSATNRDVNYATSRMMPKEIQSFTPGDYASFPKLGKIHGEYMKAFSHYVNEVKPKLEARAKTEWKNTKTIFLSATPFNTRENLDYVEGYIFKYPEGEKGGRISGRSQFYLDHFGAAYKFRYNRLEQSTSNPEAVAKQEIAFSDYLQDTLGTMSGRIIDSPYDYSRDFPTVSPDHAEQFNQAVQDAVGGHGVLADAYRKTIGDYTYGSALFETMKVANIIERIKAHLDAGRKVVIFHRRVETKEPIKPPFALMLDRANFSISLMNPGEEKNEAIQAVRAFRRKYADLLKWEQTLDYSMPREQIAKVFGKDNVLFFSGKESSKVKDKAVDIFNDDNSGKNIIVIQEASGKEGISLHDKTGEHQRVCITLALPQSPITALQIEGRTYRIGNKSNAIFEYPILGLNSEMMLFGEKFNNQVSTTENLALGSKARSLRDSFAKGILEHSGIVPIEQQGVGGKEFDAPKEQNADPYDDAVLDYYSNQKLNSRNREGVDYFPTPEPLGYKMVEWANMGEGDTAMEPSAGHGAIARYVPKGNQMTAIEPSQSLFTKLQLKAGGLGRKFVNTIFENYDLKNKHDVVVMNPPFGTAGATAIAHLGKAFKHLEEGGRVVALIPRGSTDKKFDKWIEGEKTAVLRAEVELPDIVFKQAGTKVVCRVVVVDKISNEAMRAKAGRAEKWDLGEHYDKIEDFFEDLRDVKMPDRIIDTIAIMQKKSKQTVKDLEELKGVKVDFSEGGISVNVRGDWKDYSVPFWGDGYTAEQKKKYIASTYETLEQQERQTGNETSQAVIAELKKLTCKLAGMTEEEMQRYLKKKYEGKGVMYRVEHAAEVYNKAKDGGSKGLRDGRVVPEDVDKKTSEGIEKKFDEEIGEVESDFDSKEEFTQAVSDEIFLASRYRKSVLENTKKQLENELRRKESNTGENSEGVGAGRLTSADVDNKTTLQGLRDKAQDRIALAAINRELDYRRVRAENLRNTYGLSAGSEIGFGEIEKIFRQLHTSPELGKLFAQTRDVLKRLGVDFGMLDEINSGKLTSPMGYASPERDIRYSIDGLVKTSSSKAELPVTILHEMIHEGVNGAIHLVKSGKADGMLTPKQIEAVETISEIYDRAVGNHEKFGENKYGLTNEYEFAAQMADPRQRKALDFGVMDRVVNFAKELMRKGDRSVWERVKDAVKKLFEVSDKSKMDKAIEDILSDFNKTVDDAAMADVEDNGWGYDKGVVTPEKTSGTSNAMSERIIKTVEKVAKRTGGKVKMVNSVEEIENPKVRKDIEKGKQVTGWYDEKTGEVHLYMPNIHNTYTAEKTVWHETVGHKGMRGLLGDKFDAYMRDLWMDLDNPINAELRAYVKEKMNMNHLGFYDAIEEFIAKSAEDGKGEPGFWNYIKNKVTDALHEIGYRVSPNVKDVKYMLWLAKNVQKHGDSPLWKMRAEAVRWKIEHEKTLSVVEENGMMYDNNGKKHGLLDLNKKDFDEATDGHVHYRTSPMTASKIEEYNRRLSTKWYAFKESTVDDMQSLQEAMQIISGVKDAYTDIPSAFNPLQCHNRMGSMVMQMCDRYDREYTEPLGDAFKKVVSAMPGKDGAEQTRNANLYFIKKHGLERNRVLFVRDWFKKMEKTEGADSEGLDNLDKIWNGERSDLRRALDSGQIDLREYYRQMDEWIVTKLDKDFKAEEHDYSGMHGIYDVKKGEEYDDANVIDEVMSTESQLGADLVKSFWDAKKIATDFTIDQEYANGFKDKKERDHLKEMFDWYVPLRKFDDTVAEDVYGYISGDDTKNDIGSVIEKARGRESLSDVNVLAQISALAKSSILNGGKNVEKQHFMRFVEAYEKGDAKDRIFVEIKPWVEKHTVDGNEVWEEVMPNIPENSTQEQINDILNTFEDTMKAKQANGKAKIARRKSDIGYKFERSSDMNQHIVNVYVNGRVRRFVCQGNPRAAQAINGLLRDSGTQNWATEQSAKLNRFCAQLNTSLNPDFVSSNLVRDLTFASANLTKEGMGYTWDFCKEYAKNWGSMVRRKDGGFDGGYLGMFRRYKEGRLDANNQKERWFKEFIDNGGETGFVSLKKYEDIIKEYENLVKTGNKEGDRWLMKKLKEGGAFIELANEVVENVARYSTYCVSRKRGRSIGKSIYDAKEVSSNFNRHGSGDAIKSLKTEYDGKTDIAFRKSVGWFNSWMKNHTMFYNAGVQGANLFAKNLYNNKKTAAIAFGAMPFGLSLAVALFNLWRIGREDEKKRNGVKNPYAELPEWKRRNNICIYWGGGKFKTIPMGIELRAFYGLGDIAAGYVVDESLKSDVQIGWDIIGQMAQIVPASDFLGHHSPSSGIKELAEDALLSATPTIAKPGFELAFNRDWTGRPIYRDNDYLDKAPRWKRAYDSTNDAYMTINKWANKTFNGIDSTNEDLKGSGMMADAVDFFTAPYGLQHIVEGYTGGAGATIGRTYQTVKSLVKGVVSGIKDDKGFAEGFNKEWDKVNPNTIPFYRVFNYTPKEGNDMQRTKSKWYNYVDELEQLKYNMQQMKTNTPDTAKNIHNAASKFKFSQSKDGRKLLIYEAADSYITAKRRILKKAKDKAVVEAVNEAINRKMQEAVADLDRIE